MGGEAYTCVCGGGGGGYNKRFTVPGLKTTNDVTQKHKGVKITKLRKTIATKLSKTSPIFTLRIPLCFPLLTSGCSEVSFSSSFKEKRILFR